MSKRRKRYEEEYEDEDEYEEDDEYENEDKDVTDGINREIRRIQKLMKGYSPFSQEYMILGQRLNEMTETRANDSERICNEKNAKLAEKQQWSWILPTLVQSGCAMAGSVVGQLINKSTVNMVQRNEMDNGIITPTRVTNFIQKPRN